MKAIYHQFEPVIVRWFVAAVVVALVLLIATVAAACPTCKEGLAQNDPQGRALAAGISYSILFMMSMPYIVLCTFGGLAYVSIRRARLEKDALAVEAGAAVGEVDTDNSQP
jgi:uncharacterized paraquat-inducible protein A